MDTSEQYIKMCEKAEEIQSAYWKEHYRGIVGAKDFGGYQEIEDEIGRTGDIVLLYDERGIREKWMKHITWLDLRARVKSLQVAQAQSWLGGL